MKEKISKGKHNAQEEKSKVIKHRDVKKYIFNNIIGGNNLH